MLQTNVRIFRENCYFRKKYAMVPFLKQVAAHYYGQPDIETTCFIFPNRRSLVFFRKYLSEEVAARGQRPLKVPELLTISDFFSRVYGGSVSAKLPLLVQLYRCYSALYPQAEPLDEFMFWGDTLLADFDDLDKYLANPSDLLANVAQLKEMRDDYSYLTPTQEEAIRQFLAHFTGAQAPESEIKNRFVRLWNILLPLYRDFNASLQAQGMAYEGMIYRHLASRLQDGESVRDLLEKSFEGTGRFIFVGLNALNECERVVLRKLRDARLAGFIWDYVSPEIRDKANKSSVFMERNVADFPQDFPIAGAQPDSRPEVTVISVPSAVGQAKLAPQILAGIPSENPVETAFVLPDSSLLLPLLGSIPPAWDQINVTMGYPMGSSGVYTLIKAISQLQLHLRKRPEGFYFHHRSVEEVFSSGLFRRLLSPDEEARVTRIKAQARYYIPASDLQGGPWLDTVFQAIVEDPGDASPAANHRLGAYLSELVGEAGRQLTAQGDLLELDFAKRCHTELNLLQELDLAILPATWLRVLDGLLQGISVPFQGEPLSGLQIMGPLETRALDFRNLVILSANEGVFPRHSQRVSFIPPQLRKGFGLPTHEYQDAVWAYYFYRLLQRAQRVWLLCDSRTEGLKSGEESRYIKQLEYYFHWDIQRKVASAPLRPVADEADIPKTAEAIRAIREGWLSASALKNYLYCPVQFYYQFVEGLREEDEVAESLDAGMLGTVYHEVMQGLYGTQDIISIQDIESMQKDVDELKRRIRSSVLKQMRTVEVSGRNLVLEEVILDYVQGTLRYDASLLKREGRSSFQILGLERECRAVLFGGFHFKGFLDRIDSRRAGQVRIVDYKTGRVDEQEVLITDANAAEVVERLFGPINPKWPKAALQLFLYDQLIRTDPAFQGRSTGVDNAIYSTARLFTTPLPDSPESPEFSRLMTQRVTQLLQEMTAPEIPFTRTANRNNCTHCAFKAICGR